MEEKVSLTIKEFLDAIAQYQVAYKEACDGIETAEKETQDYLHQLELGSAKARCKTATKLSQTRKRRRKYKDIITVLQPLMDWLDADGIKAINVLKSRTLGDTRKAEKSIENRQYFPRVITDLEIANIIDETKEKK
mgnify:CR=1 FL=1